MNELEFSKDPTGLIIPNIRPKSTLLPPFRPLILCSTSASVIRRRSAIIGMVSGDCSHVSGSGCWGVSRGCAGVLVGTLAGGYMDGIVSETIGNVFIEILLL